MRHLSRVSLEKSQQVTTREQVVTPHLALLCLLVRSLRLFQPVEVRVAYGENDIVHPIIRLQADCLSCFLQRLFRVSKAGGNERRGRPRLEIPRVGLLPQFVHLCRLLQFSRRSYVVGCLYTQPLPFAYLLP